MRHSKFVNAYREKLIDVQVNKQAALKIVIASKLLPWGYRAAFYSGELISWLLIPVGIYFTFFHTWWLGLLMIFAARPYVCGVLINIAQMWIIQFSLKDPEFYAAALSYKAIIVRAIDQIHPSQRLQ